MSTNVLNIRINMKNQFQKSMNMTHFFIPLKIFAIINFTYMVCKNLEKNYEAFE